MSVLKNGEHTWHCTFLILILLTLGLSAENEAAGDNAPSPAAATSSCKKADSLAYGLMSSDFKSVHTSCESYKSNILALVKSWRNYRSPWTDTNKEGMTRVLNSHVERLDPTGRKANAQVLVDTARGAANAISKSFNPDGSVKAGSMMAALEANAAIVDYRGPARSLALGHYFTTSSTDKSAFIAAYKLLMNHLQSRYAAILDRRRTEDSGSFKEGEALQMGLTEALLIMGDQLTPYEFSNYLTVLHRIAEFVYARGVNWRDGNGSYVYQTPNKYVFEASGLAVFAQSFSDLALAPTWMQGSVALMDKAYGDYVSSNDGSWIELEAGYAPTVARRFFQALTVQEIRRINRQTGLPAFSNTVLEKQRKLVEWLHGLALPGSFLVPAIGDAQNGNRPKSGICSADRIPLLLGIRTTSFCAGSIPTPNDYVLDDLIIGGMLVERTTRSLKLVPDPLEISSRLMSPSNIYVLKDKLTAAQGGKSIYASLYALPKRWGKSGLSRVRSVHNHADFLSMVLYVDGEPLIVDPGIGNSYATSDYEDYFKNMETHSTLYNERIAEKDRCTGGTSTNTDRLFECQGYSLDTGKIPDRSWLNPPAIYLANSTYNGALKATAIGKLNYDGTSHQRYLDFYKSSGAIVVTDKMTSDTHFTGRSSFKLAPGLVPRARSSTLLEVTNPSGAVVMYVSSFRNTGQFALRGPTATEGRFCYTKNAATPARNCDVSKYDIVADPSAPGRYLKIHTIEFVQGSQASNGSELYQVNLQFTPTGK